MSPNSSKRQKGHNKPWQYWASLALILVLGLFLRTWHLDRIPTGIVADELDYVLNGRAVALSGHGISSDTWSPFSLTPAPNEIPKAEFPYFISVPFVGPFGLSLFTARIGYVLVSLLFVFAVWGISTELFGIWPGVVSGLLAAINPWSVYYGRTAYDVPVAITAYLIAFYVLLRLKKSTILLSLIPLAIGFYSYIGTKVLFLPYTLIILAFAWLRQKRRDTLWYAVTALGSLVILGLFILHLHALPDSSRTGQLFTPLDAGVVKQVNAERRLTLPSPLVPFFANKLVVYTKDVTEKFLGAFSPSILFTNGEGVATFALWQHGLFYPVDAVFLLVGAAALFTISPYVLLFLVFVISVSTLPSVLSTVGTTYVHRSSLMYPFFLMIMGYGLVVSVRAVSSKYRTLFAVGISVLYAVLVANFAYLYFFRFPVYNSEAFGLSQRIYSRYMELADQKGLSTMALTVGPGGYFRNYLFYNNIPNRNNLSRIRSLITSYDIRWGNASFEKACPSKEAIDSGNTAYIVSDETPCEELFVGKPMVVIPTLSDGGSLYRIFNDKLCAPYALSSYPTGYTMNDFDVEKLSAQNFCERFIIRYTNPLYLPQKPKDN